MVTWVHKNGLCDSSEPDVSELRKMGLALAPDPLKDPSLLYIRNPERFRDAVKGSNEAGVIEVATLVFKPRRPQIYPEGVDPKVICSRKVISVRVTGNLSSEESPQPCCSEYETE